MGDKGIIASTAGLAILLNEGIGDTIRVSLTPEPGRAARARGRDRPAGPPVDGPALVPAPGIACPGCGRTTSTFFQEMAQQIQGYLKDADAGLARDPPGRRGPARRGHGLRRQRPGRVEARRHRDLACRARSRSRSRRSSSTAASIARCVATASSPSSSGSSRTTSRGVSAGRRRRRCERRLTRSGRLSGRPQRTVREARLVQRAIAVVAGHDHRDQQHEHDRVLDLDAAQGSRS